MSFSEFSKIVIDDERMIVCKDVVFNNMSKKNKQLLIEGTFPELCKKRWFIFPKRIKYMVTNCCKMWSNRFDAQVEEIEKINNWKKYPFVALLISNTKNDFYCKVIPIRIQVKI